MKIIILGAGIIGVSTAWHLLEQGHEVTVVERQPDAAWKPVSPMRHKFRSAIVSPGPTATRRSRH